MARFNTPKVEIDSTSPVVIELFTSQSCSSCPPADRVLNNAAENDAVIALGFHVTYWNHLHWKDTLSRDFSTHRQRAYAHHKGTKHVYTPQMIVNGGAEFNGSNAQKLNIEVRRARKISRIEIQKSDTSKQTLTATLPDAESGTYTLWLYGVEGSHTQDIPSGENRGRTLTYSNSVLSQKKLGSWNGKQRVVQIPLPIDATDKDDIDTMVILAQKNEYGPITAAGKIRLEPN